MAMWRELIQSYTQNGVLTEPASEGEIEAATSRPVEPAGY